MVTKGVLGATKQRNAFFLRGVFCANQTLLSRSTAPLISIIDPNDEIQRVKTEKFFQKIKKLGKNKWGPYEPVRICLWTHLSHQ